MKRKDSYETVNKIVNINQVLGRGQRVPLIEIEFKPNGFSKLSGHRIYIDYKCAKELLKKIDDSVDNLESKYFVNEFYNRIHGSKK
jgi:hypothetical protein